MKKSMFVLSAILLAALFTGAINAGEKQFKVFLVTMDQMDQHWNSVDAGCRKAAAEYPDIEYAWMAPDAKDDNKQIEIVNNAVAAGADAILIAANGPDAVTSALQEAQDHGVKIFYVDSAANFPGIATFSTNNKAAGEIAGQETLKALKAAGKTSGTIGIVSINAATASTVDRDAGFRQAFAGQGYELLATQYCEGDILKAKDIAANFIIQGCVGIFATSEGASTGTGNAIQEDGNHVIGSGFDNSDSIRNLIRSGTLICSMVQNPFVMGYEGLKAVQQELTGGYKGPKVMDTGVTVMTKDNL